MPGAATDSLAVSWQTSAQLRDLPSGRLVRACGLVVMRQQPQTAKGVVFVTLEDETGSVNVIVWKSLAEKQRSEWLHSRLMAVYGVWQREVESGGQVRHLIAKRLVDLTPLLAPMAILKPPRCQRGESLLRYNFFFCITEDSPCQSHCVCTRTSKPGL